LKNLAKLSLCKLTGLNEDEYTTMLQKCGILATAKNRWGAYKFKPNELRKILTKQNMVDYELDQSKPPGSLVQGFYLRIGGKQEGHHKSVVDQVNSFNFAPPRYGGINKLRRRLTMIIRGRDCPVSVNLFSSDDSEEDADVENNNDSNGNSDTNNSSNNGTSITDGITIGLEEFLLLRKLGINLDLTHKQNADYVKDVIGELFALQLRHSPKNKKATNEFHRYRSIKTVHAVSLMPHKSERAYEAYHRHTPYIQEFCDIMGESNEGPTRVAQFLAKKHKDVYIAVGMKNGLRVTGIMDEVESAAMWRDTRVLDGQASTMPMWRIIMIQLGIMIRTTAATMALQSQMVL